VAPDLAARSTGQLLRAHAVIRLEATVLLEHSWISAVITGILRALDPGFPAAVARRSSHCGASPAAGKQPGRTEKAGLPGSLNQAKPLGGSCSLASALPPGLEKNPSPPEAHGSPGGVDSTSERPRL